MTELCHGRPVVRLPKKQDSMIDRLSMKQQHYRDVVVSDRLYTEGIPPTVSENDIRDLVQGCDPLDARLDRAKGTGYIQFSSVDKADRAYALFNNATLKNGVCLQLKISPPGNYQEPTATSVILQIKNLPPATTEHTLYDLFRPFGAMSMCKVIINQEKTFKGTALVQYFNSSDADTAAQKMNNKSIQGNTINVSPYMSKKTRLHSGEMFVLPRNPSYSNTSPQPKLLNGNNVDYTNLYIKNLDLQVKSNDLFYYFETYGRIISARVMRNPQNNESKGFGFVSFSRADEAQRALQEMNNKQIRSKPIIVSYHEPKKPRSEKKLRSHDMVRRISTPAIPSHPPPPYMPVAPAIPEYINYSQPSPPLPQGQQQPQRRPPTAAPVNNMIKKRHSTINLPSAAPAQHLKATPLRRRSSNESASSIVTETTPGLQKYRMTEAVIRAGIKNNVEDITYMLLSLRRKERSLCLFNNEFLKEQIQSAQSALEIFKDDGDSRASPPIPAPTQYPVTVAPRVSHAIPIVAPPTPVAAPAPSPRVGDTKPAPNAVDKLLMSIAGLPLTQQKERLGDQLFPLVKATGVKHAPRITVRLLDSVPLDVLARTMHDKVALKTKIDIAVASVQQQQHQQQ